MIIWLFKIRNEYEINYLHYKNNIGQRRVDNLAVGEDACVCVRERQNLLKMKENNDETPVKTKRL